MTPVEERWRHLIALATAAAMEPSRAQTDLFNAGRAAFRQPFPTRNGKADEYLWSAFARLCEASGQSDKARRIALAPALGELARACRPLLDPPPAAPAADPDAAGRRYRADIDG